MLNTEDGHEQSIQQHCSGQGSLPPAASISFLDKNYVMILCLEYRISQKLDR